MTKILEETLMRLGQKSSEVNLIKSIMLSNTPARPHIEEIWGRLESGEKAHLRWYDLIYKRVHANLFVPVAVGCELREWGEKEDWQSGCKFCVVGRRQFKRYLTPAEIMGFVKLALTKAQLAPSFWRKKKKNIVISFSSAGEPLLHYDAVRKTIEILKQIFEERVYFSILTVGIPDGIRQLIRDKSSNGDSNIQLRLSVHFPTDELRKQYIPVFNYGLDEIIRLGAEYARVTQKRVVLHYALIQGVNDKEKHAKALIELLRGRSDYFLLRISRINRYGGCGYSPPSKSVREKFVRILHEEGGLQCVPVWRGFAEMACDTAHFI